MTDPRQTIADALERADYMNPPKLGGYHRDAILLRALSRIATETLDRAERLAAVVRAAKHRHEDGGRTANLIVMDEALAALHEGALP